LTKHYKDFSHVRANSRIGTMPYRTFIGAWCVNKAVHIYDSYARDYRKLREINHIAISKMQRNYWLLLWTHPSIKRLS